MASNSWASGVSGDWNTATLWSTGALPVATDDVVINVPNVTQAYTVTVAAGEKVAMNSLTLNAQGDGTNSSSYRGAILQMDGTLTLSATGPGTIGGSLQSVLLSNGGTFINVGDLAPFTQCGGNVLFEGTNAFYVQNELQSTGTVTVDTKSIGELIQNTLTDGIFSAVGSPQGFTTEINLGGTLGGLDVDITKIQGPADQTALYGFQGWTELQMNGPGTAINEWHNGAYVSVETTLNDVGGGGILEAMNGRGYATANAMTLESRSLMWVQGGTTSINGGLVLNAGAASAIGGVFQGFGTITNAVVNNGTMTALGGTLDIVGGLSGTGVVQFDKDYENFIQFGPSQGSIVTNPTGATLEVGTVSAGQTIVMNGDDTLVLTQPGAFAGTIDANTGDKIVLQGLTATSATYNAGKLTVLNGTNTVASINVSGSFSADSFTTNGSIIAIGTASAAPHFTITDTTTNVTSSDPGTAYSGPVTGLNWQYVTVTTDSLAITTTSPNAFIHTGSGNDAIDVSHVNGKNVLDGGTGSNFLVGGTGTDTFFLDTRNAAADIWSTVVNFHSGDDATIWGITQNDFKLSTFDNQGAAGFQGLDFSFTAAGQPNLNLTLAGYTSADLTSGKITVTYGTTAATADLPAATYMQIHAN